MNASRVLLELPPRVAWHRACVLRPLYRRAFGAFGKGTVIVSPKILRGMERIYIGESCAFFDDVWLCSEPGAGRIVIGDHNYFGHRNHLHAGSDISIGEGCVFADDVFVASTDHHRKQRSASDPTGPIRIGSHVFLGQRVTVLGGVTIGDGATVGAHAVVTKDVAPGVVVAGVPAKEVPRSSCAS